MITERLITIVAEYINYHHFQYGVNKKRGEKSMEKAMCELCGRNEAIYRHFGHSLCGECIDKFRDYVDITVSIAEQERRMQQKKIVMDDVSEFAKIKEGRKDIIRTSKAYLVGDEVEICYDGFAYKDSVKCKVIGSHKSASDGYIIELINL